MGWTSDSDATARPQNRPALSVVAPARVNLIGEHTDYTGGLVMPMAIPFTTTATITPPDHHAYTFRTNLFPTVRTMDAGDRSGRTLDWSDYSVGVVRELQALGIEPPPFTLTFEGNIPLGAGLSSSASVEVATAVALLAQMQLTMPPAEIATLCRRAENNFVGSPCGIMDQFVITNAVAGHALLLNTRDLSFELLPLNRGKLAGCVIVVANSGVKHSVADGDYGVRRREVEAGQHALRCCFPQLRDLGDASLSQLAECNDRMSPESYRRCRHIISENIRVRQAAAAMQAGDPTLLGEVMTRAHASERDDFECSTVEIDYLVDTAINLPGCYGARLTGGGFGGCTVNLVDAGQAEAFSDRLRASFLGRFGLNAQTHICSAVDGAVARTPQVARHMAHQESASC